MQLSKYNCVKYNNEYNNILSEDLTCPLDLIINKQHTTSARWFLTCSDIKAL